MSSMSPLMLFLTGIQLATASWVPTDRSEKFHLDPAFTSWSCKAHGAIGKKFCEDPTKFNLEYVSCKLSVPVQDRPNEPKRKWDCSPSSTTDRSIELQHAVKCTKSFMVEKCQLTTNVFVESFANTLLESLMTLLVLVIFGPVALIFLAVVGMFTDRSGSSSSWDTDYSSTTWDWSTTSTSYE